MIIKKYRKFRRRKYKPSEKGETINKVKIYQMMTGKPGIECVDYVLQNCSKEELRTLKVEFEPYFNQDIAIDRTLPNLINFGILSCAIFFGLSDEGAFLLKHLNISEKLVLSLLLIFSTFIGFVSALYIKFQLDTTLFANDDQKLNKMITNEIDFFLKNGNVENSLKKSDKINIEEFKRLNDYVDLYYKKYKEGYSEEESLEYIEDICNLHSVKEQINS